ncbi:MAG: IS5 family transposase [Pseudomonadota bacterium]
MKPKKPAAVIQEDFFRLRLDQLLDQRHELYRLATKIDWSSFEVHFGPLYSDEGRPAIPIRLMVGLHYLKHLFNESDESVVARWVENPYWQYFCGEDYFQHRLPIDPSQMTRFRQRIGEVGCELMLSQSIVTGLATKTVAPASLQAVNVDTTVQEKAIAFPTDARLYHKARRALVRLAQKAGIRLRQSYERVGKVVLFRQARYAHARQMKRARREQKHLRTLLGRVLRDVERKLPAQWRVRAQKLLTIARRIHQQQRADTGKVYSVHAPEVECIAKGKAHKHYEFGVKVGIVSTSKDNFILGIKALPGNPYDGHTLHDCLAQMARTTGVLPAEAFVDRGYRGHGKLPPVTVWIAGAKRGVTLAIKKKLKRRNAIEPIIGHLKTDGRLGRNFLNGELGDALNALLCGAAHNLRKILRQLALLWAQMLCILITPFLNQPLLYPPLMAEK